VRCAVSVLPRAKAAVRHYSPPGRTSTTTAIAPLRSLSPRGTSGERDGERGCKNRAIDRGISPLPDPLPTPASWGEGNISGSLRWQYQESQGVPGKPAPLLGGQSGGPTLHCRCFPGVNG